MMEATQVAMTPPTRHTRTEDVMIEMMRKGWFSVGGETDWA